jgi:hypothetical protein
MNIEQIEQQCAEHLLSYAESMADAFVDHPEDYKAAVTALLVRVLEIHLDREINIKKLLDNKQRYV